jgi:glutamate/aspartate transport system permease protein
MNYNWNWRVFWEPVAAGEGVYWEWLVSGLAWTVATALLGWIIALVIGAIVGTLRTAPIKWLAFLATCYVELFRNIPLIVQMFLWFFVVPELLPKSISMWMKQDLPYPEFATAFISLGFYTAARVAEQVRAGINSLPPGQKNAGLAMGLTLPQVYFHVLLPMAFRIVIPPLTSEFMNIFKNSAVALTIGLLELTAQARAMNEYTFQGFETFTAATIMYLVVAMIVNRGMAVVERRARVPGFVGQQVATGGH